MGALLLCALTDLVQFVADPIIVKQQLGAREASATKFRFDGSPPFIVARFGKFPSLAPHKHVTLSGHAFPLCFPAGASPAPLRIGNPANSNLIKNLAEPFPFR